MTRSELPDNWPDLAAGAALKNLSEEEQQAWTRLLDEHPELATEAQSFDAAFHRLADGVPPEPPPDHLLSNLRAIAAADLGPVATPPTKATMDVTVAQPSQAAHRSQAIQGPPRRLPRWALVGGAIAAGLAGVLTAQLYGVRGQLQQTQAELQLAQAEIDTLSQQLQVVQVQTEAINPVVETLQQPDSLIYQLAGSELADTASGRLVMSEQQDVMIVVRNLPELPDGEIYRLWAGVPTETGLIYCGQFQSNPKGIISLTPLSQQCGANPSQMIITLDAITDPTTSGGPVVMLGQI